MQNILKKAFPYFVLGLFIMGSLGYAVAAKNPAERFFLFACGALIGFIAAISPLHGLFTRLERQQPFQIATTYFQNYRIPSLLFPYSSAGKKVFLVFGIAAFFVGLLVALSVHNSKHIEFFLVSCLAALAVIGVSVGSIIKKSGLRLLPEGLLLRRLLKTVRPLTYDLRETFVPWESIKAVGLYETDSQKLVRTVFVALRVSDSEFLTAPPAARERMTRHHNETKWDLLIPAGTVQQDPIFGLFALAAAPREVVSTIDFYLRYPEARPHIGTQLSHQTLSNVLAAKRT